MQLQTVFGILEALMRARGIKRHRWQKDGIELSYHAYGKEDAETTVVLVHGLGTSTITWIKVFGALGKHFRVLAPDLPGWGYSPFPSGKSHATIGDLVTAVTRFLEDVPQRKVVLVGQSMGGWVSAKVAAKRPDLVQQLILSNNAGVLYPEVADLRKRLDLQSRKAVLEFWQDMLHHVPWTYRVFSHHYVDKMHEPRVLGFFDSLTEPDFINEDLPRLQMPVSILWGTSDRFIPAKTVDIMVQRLPAVNVHWIADCGHIPALERPHEFIRLLRAIVDPAPAGPIGRPVRP